MCSGWGETASGLLIFLVAQLLPSPRRVCRRFHLVSVSRLSNSVPVILFVLSCLPRTAWLSWVTLSLLAAHPMCRRQFWLQAFPPLPSRLHAVLVIVMSVILAKHCVAVHSAVQHYSSGTTLPWFHFFPFSCCTYPFSPFLSDQSVHAVGDVRTSTAKAHRDTTRHYNCMSGCGVG